MFIMRCLSFFWLRLYTDCNHPGTRHFLRNLYILELLAPVTALGFANVFQVTSLLQYRQVLTKALLCRHLLCIFQVEYDSKRRNLHNPKNLENVEDTTHLHTTSRVLLSIVEQD